MKNIEKHFEKHKILVEALGIDKYQFMDLYPIGRISQKSFEKDLKKEISDWKDKNLSFKYKTNCCKKSYDLESFQEYFLKNCYFKNTNIFNKITNYINGDIDYGFNYNLKCHICNKSIFDNIV